MYLRRGFNFGGGAALAAWTVQIVELRESRSGGQHRMPITVFNPPSG